MILLGTHLLFQRQQVFTMHMKKKYILTIWKINGHIKEWKKKTHTFILLKALNMKVQSYILKFLFKRII